MTIQSPTARLSFPCNGVSTVFPVNIQAYNASDFLVLATNAAGSITLTLNSDYTLASSGSLTPPFWSLTTQTGQLTSPFAAGFTLQVILNPAETQLSQYTQGQAFPSLAVQTNLDRLTQMAIRQSDILSRSIVAPDGDVSPVMALPAAALRASKNLGFDPSGNLAVNLALASGTISTATLAPFLNLSQTPAEAAAGVVPTNLAIPSHLSTGYAIVTRYGAKGDGVTDDHLAIEAAAKVANQVAFGYVAGSSTPDFFKVAQCDVFFPPGDYIYNGTGMAYTPWLCRFIGAGKEQTRIQIQQNIYFMTATGVMFAGAQGIHFFGGKGIFANVSTAANTLSQMVFTDCIFFNYTETCIGSLSTNGPHWKIQRNQFHGALSANERISFGVVLGAGTDGCDISDNEFQENKVHVKLFGGTVAGNVRKNIFERWTTSPGNLASYDVWIVPTATVPTLAGGSGLGTIVEGNRFGNENLLTTDYHVLIADENTGAGTSEFNFLPLPATASINFAGGVQFKNNECLGTGAASTAFCFSTTPNLWGMQFDNLTSGTPIASLDFLASALTDTNNAQNTISTFRQQHVGARTSQLLPAPSTVYEGIIEDPSSLWQNWNHVPAYWRTGYDPAANTELTTAVVTAFGTSNATIANITDSAGGNEAVEMTATALNGGIFATLSTPTTGRLGFICFDVQVGASLPLPNMLVTLTDNSFSANAVAYQLISGASQWRRVTIPFCVVKGAATIASLFFSAPGYSAGAATKIRIGRVRVYHAQEAVHPGTKYLDSGVVSWTPGLIANGGQANLSLTVTGAAFGDICVPAYAAALSGLLLFANVSAANTVQVTMQNNTGGNVTPSANGVRVRVFKGI